MIIFIALFMQATVRYEIVIIGYYRQFLVYINVFVLDIDRREYDHGCRNSEKPLTINYS